METATNVIVNANFQTTALKVVFGVYSLELLVKLTFI